MAVFISSEQTIGSPRDQLLLRFLAAERWLPNQVGVDHGSGALRISVAGVGIVGDVWVDLLPAYISIGDGIMAMRWRSVRLSGSEPILDADLELLVLDSRSCRLVLTGSYRSPLGTGAVVGLPFLCRAAEMTVSSFMRAAASGLERGHPVRTIRSSSFREGVADLSL